MNLDKFSKDPRVQEEGCLKRKTRKWFILLNKFTKKITVLAITLLTTF